MQPMEQAMQPINEMKIKIEAQTAAELADLFENDAERYIAEYTNLFEMLDHLATMDAEVKAMAEAIAAQEKDLAARKKRMNDRSARARTLMHEVMQTANQRKIELPQATLSITPSRAKVVITDEDKLPPALVRIKREPDKTAIKKELEAGNEVLGAMLSNGGETITIRRV